MNAITPGAYSLKLGIIKEYSYISCNYSSNCILQNCHCCQNERCKNKQSGCISKELCWQQPPSSPFVSVSVPGRTERKRARGEKRLMLTAAASAWLRLGLTSCCYRLAKRRESFLSHRSKDHGKLSFMLA